LENGWMPTQDLPTGLKPGWWPGIYRRADGTMLAVNAPDVVIPQTAASDWKAPLAELAKQHRQTNGVRGLTTPLVLAAMALILLAAITWRGGLKKAKEKGTFTRQGLEARATV